MLFLYVISQVVDYQFIMRFVFLFVIEFLYVLKKNTVVSFIGFSNRNVF